MSPVTMNPVTYTRHAEVAIATVNNPPVNALSLGVREGLMAAIAHAGADPDVKALIIIGGGRTFVAGADISEFGKPYIEPTLYAVIDALAASPKPVVAAIHGTALGGGLELALGCQWRVALASAQVGQPEVKLGLMPGAGGTQWWPRLAGPRAALEVCTSGNPVGAEAARDMGVIDRIIDGDLLAGAIAFARQVLASGVHDRHLAEGTDKVSDVDPQLFADFRKKNARKWRGLLAPWRIVDCIEAACHQSFREGAELEKAAFVECARSPQSAAQIHLFFAEREAAKLSGKAAGVRPAAVNAVAVIGAGTMGGGIAMCFANAGIPATLVDVSEETLARGLGTIRQHYTAAASRGAMTQQAADRALGLIRPTTRYEDVAQADLIVEAVFEDLALKQSVFRSLDLLARPDAILATNTSMLDIDTIAAATSRPERVTGLHFFSPANVMRLLEVVRGARTADRVLATAMGLARTLGKVAVLAGNADGFIGNRILAAYGDEADFLLEEGATPWQIDRVLQEFGFPMGLYAMRDMAGLDVIWRVRQRQRTNRCGDRRHSPIADRIYELGRYGQKTGRGYYRHEGREALPDPEIEALIETVSGELGIPRQPIGDEEILWRILCRMVNEGARILDEGVARRAGDIDVVYVHGYGFPLYRGGPMFWAQQTGLERIHDAILGYHRLHGDSWTPAALLREAAMAGKGWPEPSHGGADRHGAHQFTTKEDTSHA